MLSGSLLSFGAALLREAVDRVFRTARQIETNLNTHCLAVLPLLGDPKAAKAKGAMGIGPVGTQSACRRDDVDQPFGGAASRKAGVAGQRRQSGEGDGAHSIGPEPEFFEESRRLSRGQGRDEATDCAEPAVHAAGHRRAALGVRGSLPIDQGRRGYQRIPGHWNNLHGPRGRQVDDFVKSVRADRAYRQADHRAGRRSEKSVPLAGLGAQCKDRLAGGSQRTGRAG